MNILIRLPYFSLLLVFVIAHKGKNDLSYSDYSLSSEDYSWTEEDKRKPTSKLDMSGTLRKYFALEAALTEPKRNSICSPLSALLPLAKLAYGAKKQAESEILKAIGLRKTREIKDKYTKLISDMEYLPGVTLDIATRLYINYSAQIRSSFKSKAVRVFKSDVDNIRMSNPIEAAKEINRWVSTQTRGMIPTIIGPESISPDTSMVLVNAIFFVGTWLSPFASVATEVFHSPAGDRRVPMMTQEQYFNYALDDVLNAQIVELPYVGKQAAFILVVPRATDGLPMLLRQLKLAPELFSHALSRLKNSKLILKMPKFKIETYFDLKALYKKIGIDTIFSKKSYLSKIIKGDPPTVSHAVQKAVIEVNEWGSKGAASSHLDVVKVKLTTLRVIADRPFFFLVRAKKEQLFAGIFNGL